jgi:O-antigen ligase
MSHIRLGLYLNIAISCCIYFIFTEIKTYKKAGFVLLILYFLFSMYALGLASGFANFMILSFIVFCYFIIILNRKLKFILITVLSVGIYLILNYISNIYSTQNELIISEVNNKKEKSVNGRLYYHFDSSTQKENGNLVQINVQFEELKSEWNKRCPVDSFAYDNKHNLERYQVLMRYLTSKGANKDSAGVWALSETDIDNIRNDITNYKMPEWSYLHKRIYELVNEYDEYKNKRSVNGHSLSMRLYFWKTARYVFSNNFFTGVGTGDVQTELNKAYKITSAPLSEEWQKRPHNQFLTVAVALGVFGLLIFILSLILPLYYLSKDLHILYWPFFIIAIISFLIEDTLESQAGLTFFAFFNVLFVSMAYHKNINRHTPDK